MAVVVARSRASEFCRTPLAERGDISVAVLVRAMMMLTSLWSSVWTSRLHSEGEGEPEWDAAEDSVDMLME